MARGVVAMNMGRIMGADAFCHDDVCHAVRRVCGCGRGAVKRAGSAGAGATRR